MNEVWNLGPQTPSGGWRAIRVDMPAGEPTGLVMCCTPAVNNKRHESVCATRLSGAWRWPARSKKGKTPSALAFRGPSVDSLYMVELKLDVN